MNSKDLVYLPDKSEGLKETGFAVRYYRGPLLEERVRELEEMYDRAGWKVDPVPNMLSFVSPCGRWFDSYNRQNSQFFRVDGEWTVNLRGVNKYEVGTM